MQRLGHQRVYHHVGRLVDGGIEVQAVLTECGVGVGEDVDALAVLQRRSHQQHIETVVQAAGGTAAEAGHTRDAFPAAIKRRTLH